MDIQRIILKLKRAFAGQKKFDISLKEWDFLYRYILNHQDNFERSGKRIYLYLSKQKEDIFKYANMIGYDIEREKFYFQYISNSIEVNKRNFSRQSLYLLDLKINKETVFVLSEYIFKYVELEKIRKELLGPFKSIVVFWVVMIGVLFFIISRIREFFGVGGFMSEVADISVGSNELVFSNLPLTVGLYAFLLYFVIVYPFYYKNYLKQVGLLERQANIILLIHILIIFSQEYDDKKGYEEIGFINRDKTLNSFIQIYGSEFLEQELVEITRFLKVGKRINTPNIDFNILIENIYNKIGSLRLKGAKAKVVSYRGYKRELDLLFNDYKRYANEFINRLSGTFNILQLLAVVSMFGITLSMLIPIITNMF